MPKMSPEFAFAIGLAAGYIIALITHIDWNDDDDDDDDGDLSYEGSK